MSSGTVRAIMVEQVKEWGVERELATSKSNVAYDRINFIREAAASGVPRMERERPEGEAPHEGEGLCHLYFGNAISAWTRLFSSS